MRWTILAAATALTLGGCSQEAAPQQQAQTREALSPGQYELRWTVAELRSTDKTTPATGLTKGATGTTRACVREGGKIDPALFAEAGDQCTPSSSFVRGGRISMQLDCKREGESGQVLQSVNATSTADSLEGDVSTSTYLSGAGDYAMTRDFTGRRIGECPATPEGENTI